MSEFAIEGDLIADPGPVQIEVTNGGSQIHNLVLVGGESTPDLDPGQSATLDLGDLAGGQPTRCSARSPGTARQGWKPSWWSVATRLPTRITRPAPKGEEVDYAAIDMAMTESILAFPAATEGMGNQPLEPTRSWPTAPSSSTSPPRSRRGRSSRASLVEAWTYNGQVPGPAIRVDVGDRVPVVLHNELPMGTDVHFHGVRLPNPMDGVAPITQPLIEPGRPSPTSSSPSTRRSRCTTPTTTARCRCPTACSAPSSSATCPLPPGGRCRA